MRLRALAVLLALALPGPLAAQTLRHVEVVTPGAAELAQALEAEGWDVVEGSVLEGSLELVVDDAELAFLEGRGLAPRVLSIGRPYREIQAEERGPDAVPAGYLDLAQIVAELGAVEAAFPSICRVVDLNAHTGAPQTVEGRSIFALKISDNVAQDEDEPSFLLVSTHHSREIVTPVIALDAIQRLTSGYGSDPAITAVVDANEIWIAPVWNVDGYEYVFAVNNLWRKNRRVFATGVGVDLNRNYPTGWSNACSGSTNPGSDTYKGPSAASEAETQTMLALSQRERFAKVIDFHSSGREVLWEYQCPVHPFASYYRGGAIRLSIAQGYGGANRAPSADGEHYQWQMATFGSLAYLTETHSTFQPSYASAVAEATQLWPGTLALLQAPVPVRGHVTDACTGEPLEATVTVLGQSYVNGETNSSGGLYGAYQAFLPAGTHQLEFGLPGFVPQVHTVDVTEGASVVLDVALAPDAVASVAGTAQIGTTLVVSFDSPADAGHGYLGGLGLSGTSPGVPVGGCTFPLNPDSTFFASLAGGGGVFSGFAGVLDASGHAQASVSIPNDPNLVGTQGDFAFVTFFPRLGDLRHPSNAVHVTLQP